MARARRPPRPWWTASSPGTSSSVSGGATASAFPTRRWRRATGRRAASVGGRTPTAPSRWRVTVGMFGWSLTWRASQPRRRLDLPWMRVIPIVESMNPEDIDLRQLTADLKDALGPGEPVGYLRGKSLMRDLLVDLKGFSQQESEELIDTLELQGYLRFLGDPSERSVADAQWDIT